MSDNALDLEQSNGKKKFVRKAGKTLLLKAKDGSNISEKWFKSLEGLVSHNKTERTGSYFLTFSDTEKSLDALKHFRKEHDNDIMVKFAHYRVFFTMENLKDETDYHEIKDRHVKFVQDNTDSEVLYYKLYRNKSYLGCGDLTIDTKDALDKLLSQDQNKEFDLGSGNSGVFYRYNRKDKGSQQFHETSNVESA